MAIFTLNTEKEQSQDIAYSRDNGYTFTMYPGNPVLSINSTQFRDPKVIWHAPTSRWAMVIAYAHEFTIGVFTSSDLKSWTAASNFSHAGLLGLQYECPNLVQLPMLKNASADSPLDASNFAAEGPNWLMVISINPGAPLGGSIAQYFPGTFNGTHFVAVDAAARIADFGKDNYAGQFFDGIPPDEPQISVAWASNWQYTNVVPTANEGWRSAMSLPRYNVLANTTRIGYNMLSMPYPLDSLYTTTSPLASNSSLGNGSLVLDYGSSVPSGALDFTIRARNIPSSSPAGSLNFTMISSVTGETLRGGYLLSGDSTFFVDRSGLHGFNQNPFFTGQFSAAHPVDPDTARFEARVVVDRSIVEVFLDGGQRSATILFFAEGELDVLILGVEGLSESIEVETEVWGLKSTWADSGGRNASQVDRRAWSLAEEW